MIAMTLGMDILTAGICCSAALVLTRCLTVEEAITAVRARVLLTTVASFGLATALNKTGVAETVADFLVQSATPIGSIGVLGALFMLTSLLSCAVSANAAIVLFYPICYHAQVTYLYCQYH
jgi:di/tricarboxylate transporter